MARCEHSATFETAFSGEGEEYSWPQPLEYSNSYLFDDLGFEIAMKARNVGKRQTPIALGVHPIFKKRPEPGCGLPKFNFRCNRYFPFDPVRHVPTKNLCEVPKSLQFVNRQLTEDVRIDHCYKTLLGGRATAHWPDLGLVIIMYANEDFFHFWTDNDEFWAFETQQCVANAQSHEMKGSPSSGLRLVKPDEEISLNCRFEFYRL